jgi:parvulin-like peptidyl-prolyl isomerase
VRPALILAFLLIATPLPAETIDGIAATVDDSVITISDLDRLVALELVERLPAETNDTYRRRMLQHLIARILQRRDIRRFADIQVDEKSVDLRMERLVARHGSKEDFEQLLQRVGITLAAVRELVASEIEVRTYINERFAPLVFVPLEDIERYYQDSWSQQRRKDGLTVPPLSEVRESLRDVLRAEQLSAEVDKWTRQLRSRANVDVFVFR